MKAEIQKDIQQAKAPSLNGKSANISVVKENAAKIVRQSLSESSKVRDKRVNGTEINAKPMSRDF